VRWPAEQAETRQTIITVQRAHNSPGFGERSQIKPFKKPLSKLFGKPTTKLHEVGILGGGLILFWELDL
jgi:hypothetical protein